MTEGLIAVNGTIHTPEEASVSPLDRGFLFGDDVFEVFVGFGDTVLDLDRHLARLRRSADELGIDLPWSNEELGFELTSLVQQVDAPKTYLRLVVTRGESLGLRIPAGLKPTRVTYCFPAPEEPRSTYEGGLSLKRLSQGAADRGAAPKTGNYLKSILGLNKAAAEGYDDVLWTNPDGEITEASTSNIIFVERTGQTVRFVTPPPHSGILLGITRQTILRLLNDAQIPAVEEVIYADTLPRFDEAFLCSTVRGLVPVSRIDRQRLYTTRENALFRQVSRLFSAWVKSQIGYKVDWITGRRID